jgi:60 kDa SS-A/Ro ribonucleoprotein
MTTYLGEFQTKQTPQHEPIVGADQVANSAGGYAWAIDDWTRFDRFLILGSEGGSYYARERQLTRENAEATLRCIESDGLRVVRRIVEISEAGRAPKNDPAIFALALASAHGDVATRRAAFEVLPRVCRTGTHLFHFATYVEGFRGWGRGLRRAIGGWYNGQPAERVAFQAVKYGQRDGWSHRDLLRLAHPTPASEAHGRIFKWIVDDELTGDGNGDEPETRLIRAFVAAHQAEDVGEVVRLIRDERLPREAIPTRFLSDARVWEALLEEMPMTAMIRNLATMTRSGLLAPGSDGTRAVVRRLRDGEHLRRARVHPVAVLSALRTYAEGRGVRGQHTWTPVQPVVDALDGAFYAAFGNVTPTGKRWLLGVDVSGSMDAGVIAGVPGLAPRHAAAAMTLVTAAVEPEHIIMGFTSGGNGQGNGFHAKSGTYGWETAITPLAIGPRRRLDDVIGYMRSLPFGGTDCALPMRYATKARVEVDAFVIYTDSETWAGDVHPVQALREYRQRMGIPAKLIVVAMVSNGFTIADPDDGDMLDVVGFDTATPDLIGSFVAGAPDLPQLVRAEHDERTTGASVTC